MKNSARRGGQLLVAAVFGALAARLFQLTAHYAVNIFFWDQWDLHDAALFQHLPIWNSFGYQHGPHRQGLGGVLAATIEPWFRWNSRTEAFVATSLVVVIGLLMLHLKTRLLGPITWADAAIPLLVFTPAQWESAWNTVNFSHGSLPVILILLYCLTLTWRNERAKYAALTVLNFLTLFTGFGFFLGVVTPVLLLAAYRKQRRRDLLIYAAVSVLCLASFFVGYYNDDASGCQSLLSESPLDYLQFLCLMFITPFGIRGLDWPEAMAGGLVLAGVLAAGFVGWRGILRGGRPIDYVLATLSTYSVLFAASSAIGRTCLGPEGAHASRYSDYKELALLALLLWILRRRPRWAFALPVLLIPSLFITDFDRDAIEEQFRLKSGWRACYLAGRTIADCDKENGQLYPMPARTHLQQKLDELKATGQNLFAK